MSVAIFVLSIIVVSLMGLRLIAHAADVDMADSYRVVLFLNMLALSILGIVQGC